MRCIDCSSMLVMVTEESHCVAAYYVAIKFRNAEPKLRGTHAQDPESLLQRQGASSRCQESLVHIPGALHMMVRVSSCGEQGCEVLHSRFGWGCTRFACAWGF